MKPTLLIAVLPLIAAAATPGVQLSVPVLGYVFDPSAQTIRQATGVPGAAALEGAVTGPLKAAWVHSGARVAIVVTKGGETALMNWSSGTAQTTVLGSTSITAASFSGSGHTAVLSNGDAAEVWNLLGDATKSATFTNGEIVAAAVRDDGAAVIATGAGNIVLITASDTHVIASGGDWKALAFVPGGADVLAASATELVRLSGVDATPGQNVIASLDGLPAPGPTAIRVSADGSKAAVALEHDVLVVTLGGAVTKVVCDCSPTGLAGLAGNLVVSLGGSLVLDADAAEPRVFALQGLELPGSTGGAQ